MGKDPQTASDLFTHNLSLSWKEKILYLIMSPILVPFRIVMMLLIASMIYFSSKIGLLFSDPEVGCLQHHVDKY